MMITTFWTIRIDLNDKNGKIILTNEIVKEVAASKVLVYDENEHYIKLFLHDNFPLVNGDEVDTESVQ